MTTGNKIHHLRKAAKLTQTELGMKLGVKKNAVSKWECGRVDDIPASKIKAMASLFDVPVSYLIDDEEPGTADSRFYTNVGILGGEGSYQRVLSDGCRAYPDFVVIGSDGRSEKFFVQDSAVSMAWDAVVSVLTLDPKDLETAVRLIHALKSTK